MIISPGRNFIFVHIPKTGGTSLALALEGRAMKDDILIGDTPKAKRRRKRLDGAGTRGRLWKHSTLADIDGLVPLDQIEKAFTVTLVRNPWDRLVSYYHWLRVQDFDHAGVRAAKAMGFSDFLRSDHVANAVPRAPYDHYMTRADGVEDCSLYIRLENFVQDSEPLWAHLGFQLDLPVVNQSERPADYRALYSRDDSQLVAKLCQRDIDRFDYRFE
ncbi:MAG: sulfotransferase family 2 domain-containing protein [Pseudomonadota bacterium]